MNFDRLRIEVQLTIYFGLSDPTVRELLESLVICQHLQRNRRLSRQDFERVVELEERTIKLLIGE